MSPDDGRCIILCIFLFNCLVHKMAFDDLFVQNAIKIHTEHSITLKKVHTMKHIYFVYLAYGLVLWLCHDLMLAVSELLQSCIHHLPQILFSSFYRFSLLHYWLVHHPTYLSIKRFSSSLNSCFGLLFMAIWSLAQKVLMVPSHLDGDSVQRRDLLPYPSPV